MTHMKNGRLIGDRVCIVLDNKGKITMAYFPAKKKNRFSILFEEEAKRSVSDYYPSTYLLPFQES